MKRTALTFFALTAVLGSVANTSQAQSLVTVAAGATIPTGDYGKYANTGWTATAGVLFPVGRPGLMAGGHALFGSNSHSDLDGDKTNLLGVLGTVAYRFGDPTRPGVFVLGNVGMLRHSYSSDNFPDDEGSESGVAFGGAAGFSIPRDNMILHVSAGLLTASIEGSSTSFIPLQLGISIPFGQR